MDCICFYFHMRGTCRSLTAPSASVEDVVLENTGNMVKMKIEVARYVEANR